MNQALAEKFCSRTAVINHNEVLVDSAATSKGEGLRFYLDKDPKAANYLNLYQKYNRPKWLSATIGSIGTGMIIGGLFTSDTDKASGLSNKDILLIGGFTTLMLNYLIAKTMDYNNERYLQKSVNEYNKRNLPKIYFEPFKNPPRQGRKHSSNLGIGAGITKDF